MSNYGQANSAHTRCRLQDKTGPPVRSSSKLRSGVPVKGLKTLPQLASEFGIHPQQITDWKRQALDKFPDLFDSNSVKSTLSEQQREEIEGPLFQQIGQLKVENDWLKKNCGQTDL